MPEKKASFTPESSMFELFRKELCLYAANLHESMIKLQGEGLQTARVEGLIEALRPVRGAVCIMQFSSLVTLVDALYLFLQTMQKTRSRELLRAIPLLHQAADKFHYFGNLSDALLGAAATRQDPEIDEIINRLTAFAALPREKTPAMIGVEEREVTEQTIASLFKTELEGLVQELDLQLLELEKTKRVAEIVPCLLRTTHSLKGAARAAQFISIVKFAHTMEDCLIAFRDQKLLVSEDHIDVLLQAVDFLKNILVIPSAQLASHLASRQNEMDHLITKIKRIGHDDSKETITTESASVSRVVVKEIV